MSKYTVTIFDDSSVCICTEDGFVSFSSNSSKMINSNIDFTNEWYSQFNFTAVNAANAMRLLNDVVGLIRKTRTNVEENNE